MALRHPNNDRVRRRSYAATALALTAFLLISPQAWTQGRSQVAAPTPPGARAASPPLPKRPAAPMQGGPPQALPQGRVRLRVSPGGSIELDLPKNGAPVGAIGKPPGPLPPGGRLPPPKPAPVNGPAPLPSAAAAVPTYVPTQSLDNPFSFVRLQGPTPPAVAEGLRKMAGDRAPETLPAAESPDAAALARAGGKQTPAAGDVVAAPILNLPPLRPHFVEGDLENFVLRPMTRRNFVGVGAGLSAIPNDANALLNTFYISIEPQIDVISEKFNWKLGLGAPLNLRLLDTRGPFEECINQARGVRGMGGTEDVVAAQTASCLLGSRERVTEGFGTLRKEDWDETSDYAKVVRYFTVGRPEGEFFLNISRLFDQSLSHGTVVRDYNANINFNTTRLGATLDFNRAAIGIQGIANDLARPDVLGLMLFLRPFRPFSESVFLRSLSVGFSYAHGVNQPRRLLYEPGLFTPAFDQPIPKVDDRLNMVGGAYTPMNVSGIDIEAKLLRLSENDLKVYADFQKMENFGSGMTLGTLFRFSKGQPATQALRARAELTYFSSDFLPSYFDTYHDIFQYQYLPATYRASNGLLYSPTKVQYLEAARGGRPKLGGYFEISHSFIDRLTLSMSGRIWRSVGSKSQPNFDGLRFPDYGQACKDDGEGDLDCGNRTVRIDELGFSSLRLRAELPFRKFLQAFASYEVFSSGDEKGLGVFALDGDNEVLFGGARLMLLPFLFFQAETRRYFFLQRVTNIDLETATVQQDQRYHANWTFAFSTYIGYEF